jgi:Na+-transporting methylmalonyl-CoA/oxaloacetate decarboxylase gamma subunit
MENLDSALIITVIGMTVIFIVLFLLLVTIIGLNKAFPYQAPAPATVPSVNDAETTAVISAAITAYRGKKPGKMTIRKK